jgi:enterochelin esterase-like enzyme
MKIRHFLIPLVLLLSSYAESTLAKGTLKGPYRIDSQVLGYELQYWVYLPERVEKPLPELYVTDGNAFLAAGRLEDVLDRATAKGTIEPFAVILVDSRDPDFPELSRRNREFMCNVDYAKFYVGELMPEVSRLWTGAGPETPRGVMGVSFGAINSACFGMMLPGVFQTVVMLSPGSDKHLEVIDGQYRERPVSPASFFITNGGPDDNQEAAEQFVQTLRDKGYDVQHVATGGAHEWDDWRPLLDDSLRVFSAQLRDGAVTDGDEGDG